MEQNHYNRVLVAEDHADQGRALAELLELEGYIVDYAKDGEAAYRKLRDKRYALVLADLDMPRLDGLQLLGRIRRQNVPTTLIMITGMGTIATAVTAMKSGAYDYLEKPVQTERLFSVVPKAIEHQRLLDSHRRLERMVKDMTRYAGMVGQSPKMQELYQKISMVAGTTATVLIEGESGTGKELVAQAIHAKSMRSDGPFVAINCTAVPQGVLESELFGHVRGAFTGAIQDKEGCFEMADGGTLFLDEVADMPLETQVKLLRALETMKFRRVGGKDEVEVNVRVVAATNRNLEEARANGKLREDLFYRLNVIDFMLPPLRERLDDLELLVGTFLKQYSEENGKRVEKVSRECLKAFREYEWPGNVRELRNVIERAVVLCSGDTVSLMDIPEAILNSQGNGHADIRTLKELEREWIFKALERTGNNKTRAAKELGISLKTLHNKLNRYGRRSNGK